MSDLMDLYQEMILDHGRHPRNFGRCDPATQRVGAQGVDDDQQHILPARALFRAGGDAD